MSVKATSLKRISSWSQEQLCIKSIPHCADPVSNSSISNSFPVIKSVTYTIVCTSLLFNKPLPLWITRVNRSLKIEAVYQLKIPIRVRSAVVRFLYVREIKASISFSLLDKICFMEIFWVFIVVFYHKPGFMGG